MGIDDGLKAKLVEFDLDIRRKENSILPLWCNVNLQFDASVKFGPLNKYAKIRYWYVKEIFFLKLR